MIVLLFVFYNGCMQIGLYIIVFNVVLVFMVGVIDKFFCLLCKWLGVGLVVLEMIISDSWFWNMCKLIYCMDYEGELVLISVQIVGIELQQLVEVVCYNVDYGVQIIDINMGCLVKKVCNVWVGLVLMCDEQLVVCIFEVVVNVVDVLVMLKICIGWDCDYCNGLVIVCIVEDSGIVVLVVYGCICDQYYIGQVEYVIIGEIKVVLCILVIVNGDIDLLQKVVYVLQQIGVDVVMIGCFVQGWLWIFCEVVYYLVIGEELLLLLLVEVCDILFGYLYVLYVFYGELQGVCIVCKYLGWYVKDWLENVVFCVVVNCVEDLQSQIVLIIEYFDCLIVGELVLFLVV